MLMEALLVNSFMSLAAHYSSQVQRTLIAFFNLMLDPGWGSRDQSRGFSSLLSPMVLSVRHVRIRVKGLGRLSLFLGYASALALSQSMALNLPLAVTFLWVLGRGPTSKGRGLEALPKWGPRRCRGIAASVQGGEGKRYDQASVLEQGSGEDKPFPGALYGPSAALCSCPSAPIPLLSTTRQGVRHSSRPTFPGFSMLGASLRSG